MATRELSVLVTGATGFVGRRFVAALRQEGLDAHCLVRSQSAKRAASLADIGAVLHVADSNEVQDLRKALGEARPAVVVHLAAGGIRATDRRAEAMIDANVTLTSRLVDLAIDGGAERFIYVGSCSEYAAAPDGRLIDEDWSLNPSSVYGATKLAAGAIARAMSQAKALPFIWLRPFGIFGEGEGPDRLGPYLVRALSQGETVELTQGQQARDFTYVDDIASALLAAVRSNELQDGRSYNICSGVPTTVAKFAKTVAAALDVPESQLKFGARPYRSDESMWIVGNGDRFKQATGWTPRFSFAEGIAALVASHR